MSTSPAASMPVREYEAAMSADEQFHKVLICSGGILATACGWLFVLAQALPGFSCVEWHATDPVTRQTAISDWRFF